VAGLRGADEPLRAGIVARRRRRRRLSRLGIARARRVLGDARLGLVVVQLQPALADGEPADVQLVLGLELTIGNAGVLRGESPLAVHIDIVIGGGATL